MSQDIMKYTVAILDNTIAKAVPKDTRVVSETRRIDATSTIRSDK